MKIFSAKQIYEADKVTIEKEGIPSYNLMERAGGYVYEWMHYRLQGGRVPIKVFCGIGNNGGDGLVIARYLIENNYNVTTYVVNCSDKRSPDFMKAFNALKDKTSKWPELLKTEEETVVLMIGLKYCLIVSINPGRTYFLLIFLLACIQIVFQIRKM